METPLRSVVKAVTWQALGLVTMTGVTFAVTGSLATGSAVAVAGAAAGAVCYVLHERIWARVSWGLHQAQRIARGEGGTPGPQV